MKRNLLIIIILTILISNAKPQQTDVILPAGRDREQTIHHKAYSLSYNSSYLQPSWVVSKVSKSQVNKDEKTKMKYIADPIVNTRSANKKDYKQGGYIMAQYVNYLDVKQIQGATEETFYMSNITPMKIAFYNHIWLKTEKLIRLWTIQTDGLYIVCGPILTDSPFPMIGDNNLSVPKRYYKAVYDPKNQKAIGFIFKNGKSSGTLKSYAVSVNDIEKEGSLDLFHALDDAIEEKIESEFNVEDWDFEVLEK